ncbi:3-deoxy-D-arabinoheptulosonate-7-phosphate synthase [Abditibacterium utsteinense]|uniref:3-deoxy-D-arabinoheptulosonate-7-phosphate synthase n=1 Tax=Abditibacterium utsteinense TaxID=1960156 RepID=A0A2S8SRQ6_9BACT|nr:3-deoxy-7-phosphoheptulonate synthase [Abditibacterium utsteinense]PQV63491.1 3-deoxy-D-arabinoheptulosonate-7-phosphate synthase [Abditibacterium utsteinense]
MIIILKRNASDSQIEIVENKLKEHGYAVNVTRGTEDTILAAIGTPSLQEKELVAPQLQALEFVERVLFVSKPYKMVSRESHPEDTSFEIGLFPDAKKVTVGGQKLAIMAGPCSVENLENTEFIAREVQKVGAGVLRGGAYKPRTSPYDFQGLGLEGLQILAQARKETGLPIITEVMTPGLVEQVCEYADVLQIGARNMQNYDLLREVGKTRTPVLLKRGLSSTIEEWLKAAEYLLAGGNLNVMFCERGIRTFEPSTRFTLDLSAIPAIKRASHLPIIIDPSQGTGRRDMVASMSKAAIAAGADGLIIEVHPHPEDALSDGQQTLDTHQFAQLMSELAPIATAVGRSI